MRILNMDSGGSVSGVVGYCGSGRRDNIVRDYVSEAVVDKGGTIY